MIYIIPTTGADIMKPTDYLFIGVDTHKNQHTAAVMNCFHQFLDTIDFSNNTNSFPNLISQIKTFDDNNRKLIFGLEDTQGLGRSLAQWLIQQGYMVKDVNPALTKRERHHSTNPDKSDEIDAKAIAKILFANQADLPTIQEDEIYTSIRRIYNRHTRLVKQSTEIKNELHTLLHQQYPEYEKFFSDPFGKTALAFWSEFPHPSKLKHYGIKRLNKFLKRQVKSISNDKAKLILSLVDKDTQSDFATKTNNQLIKMAITHLKTIMQNIEKTKEKLETAIEKTDYQLTSMPGIGTILAATFISNIKNINRFNSASKLARYAGIAPVQHSSGKSSHYSSKKYGCRDLNKAFHQLALQQISKTRNGLIKNHAAYSYYQKKIDEGKAKKVAKTCLKRRLVDIIYAMMRDRSKYRIPEKRDNTIQKQAV